MNKEKLIEQYLSEPIIIGTNIKYNGEYNGSQNKNKFTSGIVTEVNKDILTIKGYENRVIYRNINEVKKDTYYIGNNPFPKKQWNSSLRIVNFSLECILHSIGFHTSTSKFRDKEYFKDVVINELNWNPFIIDSNNERIYYQRGFVWTLKENQNLINSIYNSIDIGKIVLRKRSFSWVENEIKNNVEEIAFKDIVDGKQRLNAIVLFLQNKYKDSNGYYWKDLSKYGQTQFMNFMSISYGELGENTSDADTKSVFLGINHLGVPMSKEHIEFVKNINL